MSAEDVKELLAEAIAKTGVDLVQVRHWPRLLSNYGACFISKSLQEYLHEQGMSHTRGKPYYPQTPGKVERYNRTLKNVVKLSNYYALWQLDQVIGSLWTGTTMIGTMTTRPRSRVGVRSSLNF
jgi:putative transposase